MKSSTRRWLAVFLLTLTVVQVLPAALFGALADGLVTIMGTFTPYTIYHSVLFKNEDTPYAKQLVADGTECIVPESPTKQGVGDDAYEFIGWSSNPEGIDPETDPINSNVTFTAEYETLKWVMITVEYVFDGVKPGGINLPPSQYYQVQKGKQAIIDDPTPIIKGIKADILQLNYDKIALEDETITVTYRAADPVQYTVNYWYEKPGIAGEAAVGNKDQFDVDEELTETDTVLYGELFIPATMDKPGFNREAQGYSEITDDTTYDEYYTRQEYILTLDSNGEGATYFAPEAIKYGMPLELPKVVECPGYTFGGWEPEVTEMPANDLTLKAKWKPKTVDVKVVYWLEKPGIIGDPDINDLTQFDFVHSKPESFTAGIAATIAAADVPDITAPNHAGELIPVATFYGSKTETVKGDGTTVINVYYKRVVFALSFLSFGYEQTEKEEESIAYNGKFPGGQTELVLLLKFQQPIEDVWPSQGSGYELTGINPPEGVFVGWNPGISTNPQVSAWLTRRITFTTEMLPGETNLQDEPITIEGTDYPGYMVYPVFEKKDNIAEFTISYYLQNIEDNSYTKSEEFSQKINLKSNEDIYAKVLEGFNVIGVAEYPSGETNCDFYYDRKVFPLYFETIIPDNVAVPPDKKTIPPVTGIRYGDTYAKYLPDENAWPLQNTGITDNNGLHFDFGGWYKEADCVTPVTLADTMPDIPGTDSFLQLFAKWVPSDVTVTFKVEGELHDTRTTLGGTSLDSVSGTFPADPDLVSNGLEFMGWYEEVAGQPGVPGTKPFGPSTKVYKDMTVVAKFRKIYTSYTIHYDYKDSLNTTHTDYWTPKEVLHVQVGTTLHIPGDVDIPTFQGYGILGHPTSIVLGPDKTMNNITLVYNDATTFAYKVNYYLEGTTTPVPGFQSKEGETIASRIVLWADKDQEQKYYPVKELESVRLSPNETVEVTFYYKPYIYVEYKEKAILHGSDNNGFEFSPISRSTRVGDTAEPQDTSTSKQMGGHTYRHVPGPKETHLVATPDDQFELVRNYYQEYTLQFTVNNLSYGDLDGAKSITALHNTSWSALTPKPPTPEPEDGYYFAGWDPVFPTTVVEEQTYTAIFKKNTHLLLKTNGATYTYDGGSHSVTGFKVFKEGTDVTSEYTITGITAVGASGTNAGTYTNKFKYSNPQNPVIVVADKTTGAPITEGIIITTQESDLQIDKREITVKPKNVTVTFNGQVHGGNGIEVASGSLPLVTGHTLGGTYTIDGKLVLPGTQGLTINGTVDVRRGNSSMSANYTVNIDTGLLTVNAPQTALSIYIKPGDRTATYDGSPKTVTITHTNPGAGTTVRYNGAAVPSNIRVEYSATATGTEPGGYNINVDPASVHVYETTTSTEITGQLTKDLFPGTFTINPANGSIPLTITQNYGGALPFDGTTQTMTKYNDGVVLINNALPTNGITVAFTATGSGFAPNSYPLTINKSSVVVMQNGVVVTSNYNITTVNSTFDITPLTDPDKIPVKITPNDAPSVTFDAAHHAPTVTTGTILVNGVPLAQSNQEVNITFTARTPGGFAPDTYTMSIADADVTVRSKVGNIDVKGNYRFELDTSNFVINPVTPGQEIPMALSIADETREFTGSQINVTVATYKSLRIKNNQPFPASMKLAFVATGSGQAVGTYPIAIQNILDRLQFKVEAPGLGGALKDVTDQFKPTVTPGTLRITPRSVGNRIPIEIGIVNPANVTYNRQPQSAVGIDVGKYQGVVQSIEQGYDDTNLVVTVTKPISKTDAGTYDIVFGPKDVTIMLGGVNMTTSYDITTKPGQWEIDKLELSGTVQPIPAPGSFIYGDPIPDPTLSWNLNPAGEETYLAVTVDTYDDDANSKAPLKDAGTYFYRPVLDSAQNPNYDVSGINPVDSTTLEIEKAPLTITPKRVSHEQGTPLPTTFAIDAVGYKYKETMATVGPDVTYALQSVTTGSEPIGTTGKISLVTKSREPDNNYNITYEDGDFIIHGVVIYHANYPNGQDPIVRHGIYEDQTDPISPVHARALGFGSEELAFQKWTYDPVETATNVVDASDPIGQQSIEVYAQWVPLYPLTIHHQDIIEDFELLPIEEYWLQEDTEYTLEAQEIEEYEPVYVRCFIDDVEAFTMSIDLEEGVEFTMPDKKVEAFIYYRKKELPPLREFTLEGSGRGYWLFGEDIPLAGVGSMNRGLCFE